MENHIPYILPYVRNYVWDYRTGDIIDPETGEVVGKIYTYDGYRVKDEKRRTSDEHYIIRDHEVVNLIYKYMRKYGHTRQLFAKKFTLHLDCLALAEKLGLYSSRAKRRILAEQIAEIIFKAKYLPSKKRTEDYWPTVAAIVFTAARILKIFVSEKLVCKKLGINYKKVLEAMKKKIAPYIQVPPRKISSRNEAKILILNNSEIPSEVKRRAVEIIDKAQISASPRVLAAAAIDLARTLFYIETLNEKYLTMLTQQEVAKHYGTTDVSLRVCRKKLAEELGIDHKLIDLNRIWLTARLIRAKGTFVVIAKKNNIPETAKKFKNIEKALAYARKLKKKGLKTEIYDTLTDEKIIAL